jgi:hypothetical protein
VWQRFGQTHEDYDGLYWSHFMVAMDWEDAEMWLEGATQSGWSVSQMRARRWEAVGAPDDLKPREEDIVASEWDEDSPLRPIGDVLRTAGSTDDEGSGAGYAPPSGTDDDADTEPVHTVEDAGRPDASSHRPISVAPVKPFAGLPELPDDLVEAFEQFKIAILAHRITGWQETSSEHVLAALDALKSLVVAPLEADVGCSV